MINHLRQITGLSLMEQLKAELSVILGESITRLERISEQPYAHLYAMYNRQDQAMPLLAKSYVCQGIAQQEAYKLSMLAREGIFACRRCTV